MTHQYVYPGYFQYNNQVYAWQQQQQLQQQQQQSHSKSKSKQAQQFLLYPYYTNPYPQYYLYPNQQQQQQLQQQQQQLTTPVPITTTGDTTPRGGEVQNEQQQTSAATTMTAERKRIGLVRSDTTEFEISEILSRVGLVRLPIPPDGSCMFRAVAEEKLGSQLLHEWLRKEVVEKLKENKERFSKHLQLIEETMSWDDYIQHISLPSSWGGELELQAISLIFKANIVIYSSTGCTKMDNGFDDGSGDIILWYSHGNHYDACLKEKKMDSNLFCQKIVLDLVNLLFEDENRKETDDTTLVPDPHNPYATYRNYPYESWLKARQKQQIVDSSLAMTIVSTEAQKEEDALRNNEAVALNILKEDEKEFDLATAKLTQQLSSSPPPYPTSILHYLPYKKKSKKEKHEEKDKDKKKKGFKKQFKGLFKYHHGVVPAEQVRSRSLSQ
eukprot:TRINITY_DN1513_c0_g5_i1.p1 TRINITY_DN1513_c0_g5~~TRINITY_DN1513_c0_g5_i1.p1  ORF type:complete len:441 (-),score=130.31 TRINITY_DN1513_c0_g5_i1:133-1455(-)